MNKNTALIAGILIVGAIVLAIYIVTANNSATQNPPLSPSPSQLNLSPTAAGSPTPAGMVTLTGEVLSVGSSAIGFMNARVVVIRDNEKSTNLYVTEDTTIRDSKGTRITLDDVKTGDQLMVEGSASEGGLLTTYITVTTQETPTPQASPMISPTLSTSPTPTPTD